MELPANVSELRRFLGMANQLGKFTKNLAELSKPLRELLGKNREWQWTSTQDNVFQAIKQELLQPQTLALYDSLRETKISTDASSYGLAAKGSLCVTSYVRH